MSEEKKGEEKKRLVDVDDVEDKERESDRFFEQRITRREERLRRARARPDRTIAVGLGTFGLVGWTIALPMFLGTLLGLWLDNRMGGGVRWTLGLMMLGLIIGASNVWAWLERQRREEEDES